MISLSPDASIHNPLVIGYCPSISDLNSLFLSILRLRYNLLNKTIFSRCPPLLDILLRVLSAYMDASRAFLTHHLQSHPVPAGNTSAAKIGNSDAEREELKNALIAAQESAIVQILMEICLPMDTERKVWDGYTI